MRIVYPMKFQVNLDVTQPDVDEFLQEKGLHVSWIETDVFELHDECDLVYKLCREGFEVKGVKVTVRAVIPPPPKLVWVANTL